MIVIKNFKILFAISLVFSATSIADSLKLPVAPDGFTWKQITEIKAAFLLPKGWYFKHEVKGQNLAYFISKENIDAEGTLKTGLTLNVIRKKSGTPAVEYAKQFIALSAIKFQPLKKSWETKAGLLHGYGCRVRFIPPGGPPTIMQLLAIGNINTDTRYILIFESPEATWGEAWEKGKVILKLFFIDDEV